MRKKFTVFLCLLLAIALLASCAPSDGETKPQGDDNVTDAPGSTGDEGPTEPVNIRVMTIEFPNAPTSMEQLTFKTLGEKLNLNLEFEMVSSPDYPEKLNVVLTGGDLPDFFHSPIGTIAKYYEDGVVRVLDDLLAEKGQNILKEFESHGLTKNVLADDGHYYFLPQIDESSALETSGWMNREWMEEAGIEEVPTTTDELYAALKTFKEKMPEDTIPMTQGPWYSLPWSFYRSFRTWSSWIMYDESEGYVYGPYQLADNMKLALSYMNKLYAEGLMDQEFVSRDADSIRALSANNQVGYYHTWTDHAAAIAKGGSEGRDFVIVPPLEGSNGERWTGVKAAVAFPHYIASSASDEVANKIVEMIDYMYSEEGKILFAYGVEEDTYTMEDGKPKLTDKVLNHELGELNGRRFYGMHPNYFPHVAIWDGWAQVLWPITVEAVEEGRPYNIPQQPMLSGTVEEETELATIMNDIDKYTSDSLIKFIVGELSVEDDFDDFLAQLEKMGIERAIEIQKAKFDRWLAR